MPSLTPWRCVPPGQSLLHLAALFCNVRHFVVLRCLCPFYGRRRGGNGKSSLIRVGSPRRLLGANIAPLVAEKRRPRRRWKYGPAGAVKRGRSKAMRHAVVLQPAPIDD